MTAALKDSDKYDLSTRVAVVAPAVIGHPLKNTTKNLGVQIQSSK